MSSRVSPAPAADVPSPIDFHDPAQARAWEGDTVRKRPSRPRFFERIAEAIRDGGRRLAILELGSGPGHLAEHVLGTCSVGRYVALDFSAAMHALARERLGPAAERVEFVLRDFRDPEWNTGLGLFDVVVSQQSAHEVRHKSRIPAFFRSARAATRAEGMFLYCDSYVMPGGTLDPQLHVAQDDQPRLLQEEGFLAVTLLHDEGGMALYRAINPG